MERNEKSHWYPQFKDRFFADGGISIDKTVALRVMRIDALEKFIVNLDPAHFHDPSNHNSIKDAYVAELATVKDHLTNSHSDVKRSILAMEHLDGIRRTFDGKELTNSSKIIWLPHMPVTTMALGPFISGVPNEHTDLIINATSQEILRFVIDGSTHSLVKASDFLPTPQHPGPSPCSSITPSTGGITYDLTYCIKNGEVLEAVFDNEKSLIVTIQANGDGFLKLDASDVIGPTSTINEDYSVSIDGVEKIFDDAKIYDAR